MESATALIWKVLQIAEQIFRRLNAAVYTGTQYVNGVQQQTIAQNEIAAGFPFHTY